MNKINSELIEEEIEYLINPEVMWEVMLTQIRGIIIEFAKIKKYRTSRNNEC